MATKKTEVKKITVDSGKFNICSTSSESKGIVRVYRNAVSIGNNDTLTEGALAYNVKYNDELYWVGNGAKDINHKEGKATDDHILTTLVEITRYLEPNKNEKVILGYNESITSYDDKDNIQKITNKLKKKHEIEVDGETFTFTIEELQIMPEGVGVLFLDIDKHLEETNYIVDIGGCTVNVIMANGLVADQEQSFSTTDGMTRLYNRIANKYLKKNTEFKNISPTQIKDVLNGKTTNAKLKVAVENGAEEFLLELEKNIELTIPTFDIRSLKNTANIYFVGGGSLTLKNVIDKIYGEGLVHEKALTSNVEGYQEFIDLKY